MKRYLIIASCILAAAAVVAGCGNSRGGKAVVEEEATVDSLAAAQQLEKQNSIMVKIKSLPEEPVFEIVTDLGTIKIKLYARTPLHRENFSKLALEGYYDGLLFHRVIRDFMIQGGDPLTRDLANADRFGTGGPAYTIPAEFVPEYTHLKGAIAAARKGDAANPTKASSGSQFYIVQNEEGCSHLNGQYTVFGQAIAGLDVIDKIASVEVDGRDRPLQPVKIISIKLAE